jgi:hypothetical protein
MRPREPVPEFAWGEGSARYRHPGGSEPGFVGFVLVRRESFGENREQVFRAVERREPLEHAERVLASAPDVRDVGDVDRLRRVAKRAQVRDVPSVEEAVAADDRHDLRVVGVSRPAVRLEVDVRPGERFVVENRAAVVRVDREADVLRDVTPDMTLAAVVREPIRDSALVRHARREPHGKGRSIYSDRGDVLEPKEVIPLIRDGSTCTTGVVEPYARHGRTTGSRSS